MPPIINVIRPDFIGDLFTTLPVMKPIQKKDAAVKIIE
jgi:ADP-heptose:LPS heptosyltransferase